MKGVSLTGVEDLWGKNDSRWRNHAQVAGLWEGADTIDSRLLQFSVNGKWWETLESAGITLVISREDEHLLIALATDENGDGRVSSWPIPHPSGLAVDRKTNKLYVASTRNPNQIFEFLPVCGQQYLQEGKWHKENGEKNLVPVGSRFFPGGLYIHDIARIGRELYANSVGNNSVVLLKNDGRFEHAWWPRCIEKESEPAFGINYIQLNSIAAGRSVKESFFSASSDKISSRRPGHKNYPVKGRGVLFSGKTGEPIARGLTRPHSARLHHNRLWVANSGYGEMGLINDGKFEVVTRLNGWTRGLCLHDNIAFLGTSRVIPRFSQYAPGLHTEKSRCGIHMIDIRSGEIIGSLTWPYGNQVFAIEWLPVSHVSGFPQQTKGKTREKGIEKLFYAFKT
jgi:uncharacterized protein (TIGR03032 family)